MSAKPPRLLLNLQALTGASLATRDRMQELKERYHEPESLAVTMSKALDAGAEGILTGLTPKVRASMAALRHPVPVYAVVPSLTFEERGDRTPGLDALLARGHAQATGGGRARAVVGSLARPNIIARGDWAAQIGALTELELSGLSGSDRLGVVLDAWLTDLALAAGNQRFFERFCKMVRSRFKAAAGFETNNLGLLLRRLREWGLQPDLVVGSVNPIGVRMKPSPTELLDEVGKTHTPLVAKDLRGGGAVSLAAGVDHARSRGIRGLAPDLGELDDVPGELRAIAGIPAADRQPESV